MMAKISVFVIFVAFQIAVGLVDAVLRINNESELRQARDALFNPNSDSGWILLNFVGQNSVHFAAGGEGRASEFVPRLEDDRIQYILVRVKAPSVAGRDRARDIFIQWIGPRVDKAEIAKTAAYLRDVESVLQPFHTTLKLTSRTNLNDRTIIDRTQPLFERFVID